MGRQGMEIRLRLDRLRPEAGAADDRGGGQEIRRGKEPADRCLQAELTSRHPGRGGEANGLDTASSTREPGRTSDTAAALLAVNNIEVIYNHVILVLKGVSLIVPERGIVALLGANGAGKTTSLKAISNLLRAERGEVTKGSVNFAGARIDRLDAADVVKRGLIQVMEGRHCFAHLTVEENLLTGAYTRHDGRAAVAADLERVYGYFPRLQAR